MDIWIVACAVASLLSRVGLALYTCGLVRAKNAGGSLLRHVADLSLACLAFWAIGIAVLSPTAHHGWLQSTFLFGLRGEGALPAAAYVFLILSATLLATGIVVGSLSERSRFWPSLAPSILLAGIVVPLLARWSAPAGWLGLRGFHDLAGASFIHVAAGITAAVGAIFVGPRNGKYNRDGSANVIPGHSLPLAGGGVLLLVLAGFPYILGFSVAAGASPALVAMNTLLAIAAAGLTSLAVAHLRYGKPDIYLTFSGIVAGLVALSAGADVMTNLSAVLTGAVAGILIPLLMLQVDLVWRIDDPTGALVIHGIGGAWGLLATGLFAPAPAGRFHALTSQLLGLAVAAALAAIFAAALFALLKFSVHLRAREDDEFDGLDLAEHDIGSYPDFQQTTIKSYHLREA